MKRSAAWFKYAGVALCGFLFSVNSIIAQGSAFTYQGRLLGSNGATVTGSFDLQFKLRPASSTTNQVGPTLTNAPTAISNGLFTVTLDFGASSFDGSARWLEVAVRTNGSILAYDVLSPTQPVTAAPYALRAAEATAFTGNVIDAQLSANIPRMNSNAVFTGSAAFSNATGNFNGTHSGTYTGTAVLSGTFSGNFSGTGTGTFTGTNNGTFFGNGAGITNLSVTNIVGVVQSNFNWQVMSSTNQQGQNANNYLTTNNGQTTLILPTSPVVGTTLRIAGSGAGGWVLAQNANQSILTGNLDLPAGKVWTARETSRAWRGIASSADGVKLAAVANVGNIFTSTDGGLNWTARATGLGNQAWISIASSADGNKLAAAVSSGFIYTSADSGSNWTLRDSSRAWVSIASSAAGTKLVAAVNNGLIYTSTNSGSNWIARTGGLGNLAWISVASSADGAKLVAAVNNGAMYTSADSGLVWTLRTTAQPWTCVTSSSDGTKLAATMNGNFIYISADSGVMWSARATSEAWQTISSSGDGVNLVAGVGGSGPLYTSFDSGENWIARTTNMAWIGGVFSTDGSRAAATVNNGQIFTSSSATTIGTNGSLGGNQHSSVELQYIGNGQWMPLNSIGRFTGN